MNRLVFLRMQRGLSQKQLAEMLGISPGLLSRLERGWFTRPPVGCEAKLQGVFGKEWTFHRLMQPVPDLPVEPRASEARP